MRNRLFILSLFLLLFIGPTIELSQNYQQQTSFSISFLILDDSKERIEIASYLKEILEYIGIGVVDFDVKSSNDISLRTWSYPMVNHSYIPTYREGGFDVLFIGKEWGLDLDLKGMYDTDSIVPNGNNFYQYSNPTYDYMLDFFMQEIDMLEHSEIAHQIQCVLHEDQPEISIAYLKEMFCFKSETYNIDPTLLLKRNHRSEYWNSSKYNTLNYSQPDEFSKFNCFRVEYDQFDDPVGSDALWSHCVYASLFQRGQNHHNWEPVIAKNYTVLQNPSSSLILTVDLNPNATFSNGESILAEDIAYTYQLHLTPDVKSTAYDYLSEWFQSNSSITVKDNDTVDFFISNTYDNYLKLLSFGIIDRSEVEPLVSLHGYDIFDDKPFSPFINDTLITSCGPFKIKSYNQTTQIVNLVPNEFWHGFTPHFNELNFIQISSRNIVLQNFAENKTNIIDSGYSLKYSDVDNIKDMLHLFSRSFYSETIAFNLRHPVIGTGELTPVGTPEAAKWVRKAISHAIPRQFICDKLISHKAIPGVTSIPDGCVLFCEDLNHYSFNIDLAIYYLEDGGLPDYPFNPFDQYDPYILKEDQIGKLSAYSLIFTVLLISFIACSFATKSIISFKKK